MKLRENLLCQFIAAYDKGKLPLSALENLSKKYFKCNFAAIEGIEKLIENSRKR